MKVIGLTGGIGTGKSTAAAYLKSKGFAHIDADDIGRKLTAAGSPMLPVIEAVFGPGGEMGQAGIEVIHKDGTLDRKGLASIVFTDKEKKKRLDALMFGAITERIDERIKNLTLYNEQSLCDKGHSHDNIICLAGSKNSIEAGICGILLDAPLLFEAGLESRCDTVVLMVADEAVRIERVCRRDGVTAREVRNRINSQMSDQDKIKLADIIVDNSENEARLYDELDKVFGKLFKG